MPSTCPHCGSNLITILPARGVFVLVRHYECHACHKAFAPRAYGFRAFAILLGVLFILSSLLSTTFLFTHTGGQWYAYLSPIVMMVLVIALGVRLIHLAVTCRKPYPLQRGFSVAPKSDP